MENRKPLSAETVLRVTSYDADTTLNITWHSMTIYIHRLLPLNQFIDVVQCILHDCCDDSGNFILPLVDFAMRTNIISAYIDIDLPNNGDDMYVIAYESGLYDLVCEKANKAQIASIRSCVEMYVRRGGDSCGEEVVV